jgi:hypothetical protein
VLREDAQAIVFGGYDPGSKGGTVVFNAALTLPHLSLTQGISGKDFWESSGKRVGGNLLSGFGPVLQYQQLYPGITPAVSDDPTYRRQFSIGVSTNLVDFQIRRKSDTDQALLDIQLPVQYFHQLLWDPIGGRPGSPMARGADQIGFGLNIDLHVTRHISIFGQAGGQYSNVGGWGWSPILFGVGVHSEAQ